MNKKIVSLVLAMFLSVGFGSSSLFGYSYTQYSDEFSSYYAGKTDDKSVTVKIGSADDKLGGNLTAVFGYYAGSLVSYQGAGGQFQIYDSYGARFTADNKGGAWNVSGVNLRTSDLAEIEKFSNAEDFLKSMGFSAESLSVAKMDKDGNLLDEKGNPVKANDGSSAMGKSSISTEWFSKLKDTLKSGANFSASVQVGTGMTGPSLTISENGKAQITYNTDPATGGARPTSLYVYDDNGFQIGVQQATFEIQSTENGNAQGKWTFNYTATSYDSNGVRTDTTYQFFNWQNDPVATISSGSIPKANGDSKVSASTPAQITSVTHFSANNSAVYAVDYTTNNTTYFANNRASYVVNEAGITTQLYSYTANGVMQAHFNAAGTDAKGNKVGTTTLYDEWGRQLFTATTGSPDAVFNNPTATKALLNEYYSSIKNGGFDTADFEKQADGTYKPVGGTSISNVCIYADQILNTNNSAIMTNGFIDMAKVNNYLTSGNVNSILSNNLSGFGYQTNDILNMLRFANGTNTALASISIAHSSWDENNPPKGSVDDRSAGNTTTVTDTVGTVSKSMGTHKWHQIVGTEKANDGRTTKNGICYNSTVLLGGAQAYSFTHNVITETIKVQNVNAVLETDPAVEGTLWPTEETSEEEIMKMAEKLGIDTSDEEAMKNLRNGFYEDASGQTYAIVDVNSVNIMDGEGFKSAKGEIMMVAVDKETKEKIVNNMESSNDRSIMFMGDVRESSTGYLTMTMKTNYGGGYVQGSSAIDEAKKDISDKSRTVSLAKDKLNNGEISQAEYDKIVEDNGWVGANTDTNLDKFAKGQFSWDNKKDAKTNLEDAWKVLLANF